MRQVTISLPLSERLLAELRDAHSVMAKQNLSSELLRSVLAEILPAPVRSAEAQHAE
jgi:hypothetical protein